MLDHNNHSVQIEEHILIRGQKESTCFSKGVNIMFPYLRNVLNPVSLLKGIIKPINLFTLQFLLAFKCIFVFEKLFWPQNSKNPSTNPKALY